MDVLGISCLNYKRNDFRIVNDIILLVVIKYEL